MLNFIMKRKSNFQRTVKAENLALFKFLFLTKHLAYRKIFKKMILFFKLKKHLKKKKKEKTNTGYYLNTNSKKRKMTYSYKMFKFIKQQNYKKPITKKNYLLSNYSFFYLFFLFKNLSSDGQIWPFKKKIYNFLKMNFNIIGTKSELINKSPIKAFKFLFFLLKIQQNKKKIKKKIKKSRKKSFFR